LKFIREAEEKERVTGLHKHTLARGLKSTRD
jgi:hypothetical protein